MKASSAILLASDGERSAARAADVRLAARNPAGTSETNARRVIISIPLLKYRRIQAAKAVISH
jgi:hypothetical protein